MRPLSLSCMGHAVLLLVIPVFSLVSTTNLMAQEAPSTSAPPAPSTAQTPTDLLPPPPPPPPSNYDPAIFLKPMPAAQLAFLTQFDGAPASDLFRDRGFRKLMKNFIPDCTFHYGSDKALSSALDEVFDRSQIPVRIRDGRYLLLTGLNGQYLGGRGFLWLDLYDGIGLGGFFFRPTNGEPTPSLVVFSRQIKAEPLALSDLPPAFTQDLVHWDDDAHIPPVLTRYFITGANRRILLEHDEDFCSLPDGSVAPRGSDCEQLNYEAADDDLTAAYYLEQVNYRTNATAWQISGDQTAFIGLRDRSCGGIANPLACRIRLTRERVHVIAGRPTHR